jgi:hypothetical protein
MSLVTLIKKRIINFVKSNLKLELTKGEITHIASSKVSFLGMDISGVPYSQFSTKFGKVLEKKKRIKNRLIIQSNLKNARILKALQQALKKAVNEKKFINIKNSSDLKLKFQAIKESVVSDQKFSEVSVKSYKEFIKSLYITHKFIPAFLNKTLKNFETELKK